MQRIILFILTNLAVMLVLSIVLAILMPALGLDSSSNMGLLVISGVFGMGGSVISLLMSKWIAKRSVGARVIEHARQGLGHRRSQSTTRQKSTRSRPARAETTRWLPSVPDFFEV